MQGLLRWSRKATLGSEALDGWTLHPGERAVWAPPMSPLTCTLKHNSILSVSYVQDACRGRGYT